MARHPKTHSTSQVRQLLDEASAGDRKALENLIPIVYDELRRLASSQLRRERRQHTLQTTGLVHEAYLRLAGQPKLSWENWSEFRAIAATTMRRILVEYARARRAQKRGGSHIAVSLDDDLAVTGSNTVDIEAIDEALNRLASFDAQQARLVEFRFFAGMTIEETAAALGISPATVKREWAVARAWLRRELE